MWEYVGKFPWEYTGYVLPELDTNSDESPTETGAL